MVVDGLIAPLAAEPAVPAMDLLDSLADQLTRLRRRARLKIVRPRRRRSVGGSQPLREAMR